MSKDNIQRCVLCSKERKAGHLLLLHVVNIMHLTMLTYFTMGLIHLFFTGYTSSWPVFQASVSLTWAEVWLTDRRSCFASMSLMLHLSLILLFSKSLSTLFCAI